MKKAIAALALMASAIPAVQAQTVAPRMFGVKLAVADFPRTIQFYTLLGMHEGPHHNPYEWELKWDGADRGSSIIMVKADQSARFHVVHGAGVLIFSTPDLPAALARLRAAGFPVTGEPHVTAQSAIIMIQDPDGNWIELGGPPPH